MFSLSGHVRLDSGLPLICRAIQQLAGSQSIQCIFYIPNHPWYYPVLLIVGMVKKKKKKTLDGLSFPPGSHILESGIEGGGRGDRDGEDM